MADDNYKAGIPTQELKLGNGETVVLYTYLTTGENREVQKLMFKGGKFNTETNKMESLDPVAFMDVQDKTVEFLVKNIIGSDGTTVKPFLKEWLNQLPSMDGDLIYAKVGEAINVSKLDDKAKKG